MKFDSWGHGMTAIEWILGIVGAVIVGAVGYIGKILASMPTEYVPRNQVDARFRDLEGRLHGDMVAQEQRSDRQFDTMNGKLDRIIDKLDNKADK